MPPTSWFLQLFLKSHQTLSCCYSFYLPNQCFMQRTVFLYRENRYAAFYLSDGRVGSGEVLNDPLGEALWGSRAGEGRMFCILGSLVLCLNARPLYFSHPSSPGIIFLGEEKAEKQIMGDTRLCICVQDHRQLLGGRGVSVVGWMGTNVSASGGYYRGNISSREMLGSFPPGGLTGGNRLPHWGDFPGLPNGRRKMEKLSLDSF